jgi:hypothetical protein
MEIEILGAQQFLCDKQDQLYIKSNNIQWSLRLN